MSKKKELTFTSKKRDVIQVKDGLYEAEIVTVSEVMANETPQIEINFQTENGRIKHWLNLHGYKKDENGDFITDKEGKRILDEKNTETALDIMGNFLFDAGVPEEEKVSISKLGNILKGRKMGIEVGFNNRGKRGVIATMSLERLEVVRKVRQSEKDQSFA